MSSREKTLAMAVGGIAFLLVSFFVIDYFVKSQSRLRAEVVSKEKQLKSVRLLTADRETWEKREAWLDAKQPKLANEDRAGAELLDRVKDIARKHTVLLDNPGIRPPNRRPDYVSVAIDIDTKSSWSALIKFLNELQTPENFIVLESANLKIDGTDATKMHGHFRVARWYAPR